MTWDAGVHLLVVLSPVGSPEKAETKVGSHIPLYQLNTGETGLVKQPVCQLSLDSMDGPRFQFYFTSGACDDPRHS